MDYLKENKKEAMKRGLRGRSGTSWETSGGDESMYEVLKMVAKDYF